jgi:PAS domain S-box-containing protein
LGSSLNSFKPLSMAGTDIRLRELERQLMLANQQLSSLKETDDKTLTNSNKYKGLLESISSAVFEVDYIGKITYISPVVEFILGETPERLIGRKLSDTMNISDALCLADMDRLAQNQQIVSEYKLQFRNQSIKWIRLSANAIYNDDAFCGAVGTLVDVTDSKTAEIELLRSNTLYRSMIDASPDAIVISDLNGNIKIASPSTNQMFGLANEPINRTINSLFAISDQERITQTMGDIAMGNSSVLIEFWGRKTNTGKAFLTEVNVSLISSEVSLPDSLFWVIRDVSNRERTEERLAISQDAYRLIIETINDVIFETAIDGTVLFLSPAIKRISGYLPEEVVGKNFFDFIFADDRAMLYEAFYSLVMTEHSNREYRVITKNGDIRWVRSSSKPIVLNGQFIGASGLLIDIHDRRMAEEQLRILSTAVEQSPVSIVISDLYGNIEYVNPKACEISGYSQSELVGKNTNIFKSGLTSPNDYNDLWATITNRKDWHGILLNKRKNGSFYWETTTISPVIAPDGMTTHFLAVKLDITDRKKTEEALLVSEERFRQIAEQNLSVVWEIDMEGMFTYVSPLAEVVWGISPGELVGKRKYVELYNNSKAVRELKKLLSRNKGIKDFINALKTVDGRTIWISTNALPIVNADNIQMGFRGADIDITLRVNDQAQIKQQNQRLQALVHAIPDMIFSLNEDGVYLDFLGSDDSLLVVSKQKVHGTHISEIFNQEETKLQLSMIDECIGQKKLVAFEYSLNINRRQHFFEARMVPDGKNHVLAFVRDITERKAIEAQIIELNANLELKIQERTSQLENINNNLTLEIEQRKRMEEALLESEHKYRNVVENVKEVIFQIDKYGCFLFLNAAWTDILGFQVTESIGCSIVDFVFPDDSDEFASLLATKLSTTNDSFHCEIRFVSMNGQTRWIEMTTKIGREIDTYGAYGTLQDITVRKLAEEELLRKTTELENFFDVSLDLLCIADMKGNMVKANRAWEDILGYPMEKISTGNFFDLIHPDDMNATIGAVSLLSLQFPINTFVNRYLSANGAIHILEWRAVPFGKMIYAGARDITERRRAEEFEEEMLKLSPKLTGLMTDEISSAIQMALEQVAKFLKADRAYVFEFDDSNTTMSNTYEWCSSGIASRLAEYQNIAIDEFPQSIRTILNHQNVIIDSVSDLPDHWEQERDRLNNMGIKSLLAMPLVAENKVVGFAGLDSMRSYREFSSSEMNTLKVWCSMIASLIRNQRSERLLAQTRQNFENFFNSIDDFIWVFDANGGIIHANKAVNQRLGFGPRDIPNMNIASVHSIESKKLVDEVVFKMSIGEIDHYNIPLITKTGGLIPVETIVKPGFWNGNPVMFGVSKDLSAIQQSEQKFASAFHSNSAIMAISRLDNGKYIDVNSSFCELVGYAKQVILENTNRTISFFKDEGLWPIIIDKLTKGIEVRRQEVEVKGQDDISKMVFLSAEIIYLNTIACVLTVAVDITERKMMEKELESARFEAEKANMAKSEFLSRMSHELRTPLNSILGFAQLLEMGELRGTQPKSVGHIIKSGKHLLQLINEVLDISKIESGKILVSIEPVEIFNSIAEAVGSVQPLADSNNITITNIAAGNAPLFVMADKQRLLQVLLNLLNNAIKYNKPNGLVEVSCRYSADKSKVRILVHDSGIGIAHNDIGRLFTPFERIGAEKTAVEGTGLGLSVVKKLMLAMEGDVGCNSTQGIGSTFWIELNVTSNSSANMVNLSTSDGILHLQSPKTGTVIYIEDNQQNIDLMRQVFQAFLPNLKLITDTLGGNAVSLALKFNPKLILLDLDLPDMHGSDVLSALKSNNQLANIPVVIVSADAMVFSDNKTLIGQVEHFVAKPFDIIKIVDAIDGLVN